MNLAFTFALVAATISLVTAIAHFAIARAPGWGGARRFAWIALSAALYSLADMFMVIEGVPDRLLPWIARWSYAWAHFHILAWFPFAFAGAGPPSRPLPRPVAAFLWISGAIGVLMAVTGWHLTGETYALPVPWAHVTYHYTIESPAGNVYTAFVVLSLLVPFAVIVRRALRGEPELWSVVAGFTVFLACAAVEALVAERLMTTISPADIGFMAIVVPTSILLMRRFLADARRLDAFSRDLAGQVRDRTEERDRAERALAEAEHLAALGRLAAGVGHEVNNPLTYMRSALDRLRDHAEATRAPAEVNEALDAAVEGAERIRRVVDRLRTSSRRPIERAPQQPTALVQAALRVAAPQLRRVPRVETELAEVPPVEGDEPALVQALVNLLVNAAQAMDDAGAAARVLVRVRALGASEVGLEVLDEGPGVPDDVRERLGEPYFTTRSAEGGLGLGLFVARGIVDAHGGRLEFAPVLPHGLCARITLPALVGDGVASHLPVAATSAVAPAPHAAPADANVVSTRVVTAPSAPPVAAAPAVTAPAIAPAPGRAPAAAPRAPGRPRVLVADDEPLVLGMFARLLSREFEVVTAEGGAEAIEHLGHGDYAAVVCDLMMPGVSGMDVARALEVRWPGLRRRTVFLTGGAMASEAADFLARPDVTSLLKPVASPALLAAVRAAATRD